MKLANFIGGAYMAPENGSYLDSTNPATGKVENQVPRSCAADVERAVCAAEAAFPGWASTSASERAAMLYRIADGLERRLEAFAEAESRDQGKPVSLARNVDIPRAVANFRFFAGAILHHEDQATSMDGDALNYSHRKPVGVAGLISPWNLPMYLMTWKIAPAIACGNTCVVKPSELTSLTAYMFGEVLQEAGLPAGVCNIVFGLGSEAGAVLVSHPRVPLISFTGGTKTAQTIVCDAAPYFKKMSLELGGKNANIIFDDANLDICIPTTVRSSFTNQGEVCLCGSRIFVQRGVYDTFLERFVEGVRKIKVGDPHAPDTDMGAINSKAHWEKVTSYVALAREEGGEIVCGGDVPKLSAELSGGYFLNPTVITGLTPSCRVMNEEIFGPVVTVTPFDTEEEVIAYANQTIYGLSATIWSTNVDRAHLVAQAMHAGIIWVNTWMMRDLRTPFGGMKASGVGREGGKHSIDFYTEVQNICIKHSRAFVPQPLMGGGKVLAATAPAPAPATPQPPVSALELSAVNATKAPPPVGAYPHARREGSLLFLSGIGPRKAGTSEIPGVTFDADGNVIAEDIRTQTRSVVENVRTVLEAAGSSMDKMIDVQCFLTNMKRDFKGFNEIYSELMGPYGATRTTVEVGALPTPIAVEFKIIAKA